MGLYGCALGNVLVQHSYFVLEQLLIDEPNGMDMSLLASLMCDVDRLR